MRFNQFYLTEATNALYHATSINALYNILSDNAIKLTLSIEADELVNRGKYYYLSCSIVKYGRYASAKSNDVVYNVILDLNATNISHVAQIKQTDYWGDAFKKLPNFREEQEERIISNNPDLKPLSKYLNAVHIFLDIKDTLKPNEYTLFSDIDKLKNNTKIYYYTNALAFKMQRIEKATTNILNIITPFKPDYELYGLLFKNKNDNEYHYGFGNLTKQEAEDVIKDEPTAKIIPMADVDPNEIKDKSPAKYDAKDLKTFIDAFTNQPITSTEKYNIRSIAAANDINSITATLHNLKKYHTHSDLINKFVNLMKKYKYNNTNQFIKFALETIYNNLRD